MKIKVKVHPNSSKEEVKKISEREYEMWIKEKPFLGRGNKDVEKNLKKYFGKVCEVISGRNSKIKFVEVYN